MDRPRSGPTLIEVHTGGSRREGQCEDMFRPQGRIRTTLEPLRSKDLHEGAGCTLPFERVPLDYTGDLPWAFWPVVSSSSLPRVV